MTLIKICGITNKADRDMCLNEGVDFIGFNIYKESKRYVNPEKLKELIIPEVRKSSVVVSVNTSFDELETIIKKYMPKYVQLHGNEDIDTIKKIKEEYPDIAVIKMVSIDQSGRFEEILEVADYILCDTLTHKFGGSGKKFNWEKLNSLNKKIREKLFVAGGVNPDNVEELLRMDVFCVDVASGSEISPGKKDPYKVKSLIKKVKNYGK